MLEPCPGGCVNVQLDGTFVANVSRSKSVLGRLIWVRFLVTHQFNSTAGTGESRCPLFLLSITFMYLILIDIGMVHMGRYDSPFFAAAGYMQIVVCTFSSCLVRDSELPFPLRCNHTAKLLA